MATLGQLRGVAKTLGVTPSAIRSATSAEELQTLINEAMNGGSPAKPARKSSAAKRPVRKSATPARAAKKSPANKPVPAVKSPVGKAKRPAAVNGDEDAGRRLLAGIDYGYTEGWNPRDGSPPDVIVKSLRKHKGNRESVFKALVGNIAAFVGAKKQDGTKRTKQEREDMLRYRISRTAWDFAMKTGQHEKSDNRAEYGTVNPTVKKAPARKTPVRKAAARKPDVARRPAKKTPARPAKKRRPVRR